MTTRVDLQPCLIPVPLKERRQWVASRVERRNGKSSKVPYDVRTGTHASTKDPNTWAPFAEVALAVQQDGYDGAAFVLTPDDPLCGLDLDKCRDPDTGEIEPWAVEIIGLLASYTEISLSGTGVRIFVFAQLPGGRGRTNDLLEIYDRAKALIVTGCHLDGTPWAVEGRQTEVDQLLADRFPNRPEVEAVKADITGWERVDTSAARAKALSRLSDWKTGRLRGLLDEPAGYVPDVHKSLSEADWQVVCLLMEGGLSDAEVAAVWRSSALGTRAKVQGRADYFLGTIAEARARARPATATELVTAKFAPTKVSDLLAKPRTPRTYYWQSIVPRGGITGCAAHPKTGKTYMAYYIAKRVARGEPVFGLATNPTPVLILALEEHPEDAQERCREFGIGEGVYLQGGPMRIDEVARDLAAWARDKGGGLIIVDTMTRFWNVEDAKDPVQVSAFFETCRAIAHPTGAAFFFLMQLRKSQGDEGTDIAHSMEVLANCDVAFALRRYQKGERNERILEFFSRYRETPEELIVRLDADGNYVARGERRSVEDSVLAERVWAALDGEVYRSRDELVDLTALKRGDLTRALHTLEDKLDVIGTGKRGSPYLYRQAAAELISGGNTLKGNPPQIETEADGADLL